MNLSYFFTGSLPHKRPVPYGDRSAVVPRPAASEDAQPGFSIDFLAHRRPSRPRFNRVFTGLSRLVCRTKRPIRPSSCLLLYVAAFLVIGGCQSEFNVPVLARGKKGQKAASGSKETNSAKSQSPFGGGKSYSDMLTGKNSQAGDSASSSIMGGQSNSTANPSAASGSSSAPSNASEGPRSDGAPSAMPQSSGQKGPSNTTNAPGSSNNNTQSEGATGTDSKSSSAAGTPKPPSAFLDEAPRVYAETASSEEDAAQPAQTERMDGPIMEKMPSPSEETWILPDPPTKIVWVHPSQAGQMELRLEDESGLPWPSVVQKVQNGQGGTSFSLEPTLPLMPEHAKTYRLVFHWSVRSGDASPPTKRQWACLIAVDNPDLKVNTLPWKKPPPKKKRKKRRRRRGR